MKKTISSIIVGFTILGTVSSVSAAPSLTDINGHWGEKQIGFAVTAGFVDGYPDGTFKPDQNITRAELMAMITRGTGLEIAATNEGEWFEPYKTALTKTKAFREDDFVAGDLNNDASRIEMVKIALRTAKPDLQPEGSNLSDQAFMYNAVKDGLVQGVSNGQLDPHGLTTRAQAVTIIERLLELKKGKTLDVDQSALAFAKAEMSGTNVDTIPGLKLKPRNINKKFELGKDAYAMVTQVILADPANSKDPFLRMFDMERFPTTVTKEDSYIAAIKYRVWVGDRADRSVMLYDLQHFPLVGKTGNIKVLTDPLTRVIKFDEPGEHEGWIAGTVKKKHTNKNTPLEIITIHLNGQNIIVAADPERFKEE